MPAAIAHYLLAQRVLCNSAFEAPAPLHSNAFLWGAQGPDFFFTHRFFPWQRGESLQFIGDKLHHSAPSEIFDYAQEVKERLDPVTLSYLLGFLCHYAFDSVAHPFVRFSAEAMHKIVTPSTVSTCHNEIEANLDIILLRYERAALPTDFPLKKAVPKDEAVKEAMVRFFPPLLQRLYGAKVPGALVAQAVDDCRTAFGIMTDRTTLKRKIAVRLEKNRVPKLSCHVRSMTEETDFDYANILHSEWRWPMDSAEVRTESFLELYEQAVEYAQALLSGFLSGSSMSVLTEERSF